MAYVTMPPETDEFGLGCGPGCGCRPRNGGSRGPTLGQWYVSEEDDEPGAASASFGLGSVVERPCPERASTTNIRCRIPQACPGVPDLICARSVAGLPFEYTPRAVRDPSRGVFVVREADRRVPRTQRYRPPVRVALERFVRDMTRFGMPVEAILTAGSLYCRCVTGTNRLSDHSFGEAIDIVGVRWRRPDGSPSRLRETIVHNWNDAGERAVLRRINACLRLAFPLVIDYHRRDHRDHFHCDLNRVGRPPGPFVWLRSHGSSTWRFVQEALGVVTGRPLRITGQMDAATRAALAGFAGVPVPALASRATVDRILERLFEHVAAGAGVPMPAPGPAAPAPGRGGTNGRPARPSQPAVPAERALIDAAIRRGIRSEGRLTDLLFHARHPERRGRPIQQGEPALAREWVSLRDRFVRPTLREASRGGGGLHQAPPTPVPTEAPADAGHAIPTRLGTLVAELPARATFRYRFTPEDVLWTARFIVGEAGGQDDPENRAVIWAMLNRYAFFTHRHYPTFHAFLRAYSTPLQPVLRSWQAAQRHAHRQSFVRTGGFYPSPPAPPGLPLGQTRRHLDLQRTPWSRLPAPARSLAVRALRGDVPNPVGNATEFASTRILYRQRHGAEPTREQWKAYTARFKRRAGFRWIGDVPGIDQTKNAFFVRTVRANPGDRSSPRVSELPGPAARVLTPGG